jgi:hypothetical protein
MAISDPTSFLKAANPIPKGEQGNDLVDQRIRELRDSGLTYGETVATLNQEGFTTPTGKAWTVYTLQYRLNDGRRARVRTRKRRMVLNSIESESRPAPRPVQRLPEVAVGILKDKGLSDAQKIRMLLLYSEAA